MTDSPARVALRRRDLPGNTRVLALIGELDYHSLPLIRDAVGRELVPLHPAYVVDLSGLRFLDSTGLGFLLGLGKRIQGKQSRLLLMLPPPQIEKLLRTTGVNQLMTVVYSEEEAVGMISGGGSRTATT